MFTGLVEEVGTVARVDRKGASARLTITATIGASNLVLGESIAVNGVCITVARILPNGFEADLSAETLARSTLGGFGPSSEVNLERATPLGARMGGHVVLGHVDGTGTLASVRKVDDAQHTVFSAPAELARYLAMKGSIAVDGVSLTVNEVEDVAGGVKFSVMLVPHTLAKTTLPSLTVGSRVNLEVDVLARYVERQLGLAAKTGGDDSLMEKLRGGGFI